MSRAVCGISRGLKGTALVIAHPPTSKDATVTATWGSFQKAGLRDTNPLSSKVPMKVLRWRLC